VALCFEVTINDEPPVIAGLDDISVLAATVTYAAVHNEMECRVGGLVSKGRHHNEHCEWLLRDLRMGDQIVIRLVDAPTPSSPTRRHRRDPATCENDERRYYEQLKARYERSGD
jgi:hypothetical protein